MSQRKEKLERAAEARGFEKTLEIAATPNIRGTKDMSYL